MDYEIQFKDISEDDWNSMASWPACRVFPGNMKNATRTAFNYAACTEDEGIDVAFAKFTGDYYVWSAA